MNPLTRGTPATDAYLDLQNQARRTGRPTDELLRLYILEGFLARLAASTVRDRLVLKGGVLLAVFGIRRPTRDVDLAALRLSNDTDRMRDLVRTILTTRPAHEDGITYDTSSLTAASIRDEEDYTGVRITATATLASAALSFGIDINVGDPIVPAPQPIQVPRLRGGSDLDLIGYPLPMVHAEKIVTAIQRGTANTRWRDFGDIWALTRTHPITETGLRAALTGVAEHRHVTLQPLATTLPGYADLAQPRWTAWRRRSNSDHLPEQFHTVLDAIIEFTDTLLTSEPRTRTWNPHRHDWEEA